MVYKQAQFLPRAHLPGRETENRPANNKWQWKLPFLKAMSFKEHSSGQVSTCGKGAQKGLPEEVTLQWWLEGAEDQLHEETANTRAGRGTSMTKGPKIAKDLVCLGHSGGLQHCETVVNKEQRNTRQGWWGGQGADRSHGAPLTGLRVWILFFVWWEATEGSKEGNDTMWFKF